MTFNPYLLIIYWLSVIIFFTGCDTKTVNKENINKKNIPIITHNSTKLIEHWNLNALNYLSVNNDSSNLYIRKIRNKKNEISNENVKAESYYIFGIDYKNKGILDSANYYLNASLEIYKRLKKDSDIVKVKIALAEYYRAAYMLEKASTNAIQAIRLATQYKLESFLPAAYNRLAAIYFERSINNSCIDCFYNNITRQAIVYADSSLYWEAQTKQVKLTASNYNILGACYKNLQQYKTSNFYLHKALALAVLDSNVFEYPMLYRNIGINYFKTKKIDSAIYALTKGVEWSERLTLNSSLWQNYYALYTVYEKGKNNAMALHYLKRADSLQLVVFNQNSIAKTKEFEEMYKARESKLLIKQQSTELKNQRNKLLITALLIVMAVITITVGVYLIRKIKLRNKELSQKNKQLELKQMEIDKLTGFKDDLMSMIVHDLKNPLSTIINMTNLIERLIIPVDALNYNRNIKYTAHNMVNLVNNIIDVKKMQEATLKLDLYKESVTAIINQAIEELVFFANQKNIKLNNEIDVMYFSMVDAVLVKRVVLNLISNAIKHSPNNSNVRIYAERADNQIKFCFEDIGNGVPTDKIDILFNKYARVEVKNLGYSSSSGLGLAFIKRQ